MSFITFNILTPTSDISSSTTSCNYSYWHVSLFNEFGKLDKICWTNMFNVKYIVKPSIMKAVLLVDAINKALIFVKSKHVFIV